MYTLRLYIESYIYARKLAGLHNNMCDIEHKVGGSHSLESHFLYISSKYFRIKVNRQTIFM